MKGLLLQLVFLTLLLVYFQSASAQCTPGVFEFTNEVVTPDYVTGYPLACVNGSYTPICNQMTLGLTEIFYMCSSAGIDTTGQFSLSLSLPPFLPSSSLFPSFFISFSIIIQFHMLVRLLMSRCLHSMPLIMMILLLL